MCPKCRTNRHLERLEAAGKGTTAYTRYVGQNIAVDQLKRRKDDDKNALSNSTLFQIWCNRFPGDFTVYRFVDL